MQVQTERGLIWVETEYQSAENAKKDGYYYAFHSSMVGDVYSKSLDDNGYYHSFALIAGTR